MEILFLVLIIGFVPRSVYLDQSKRLLLNDPAIVQDRLNRLEYLLIDLNNTVTQQAQTIGQQAATIHQQSIDLQTQATTIQKQAADILFLKTSLKGSGSTYVIWGRKQCPKTNFTEQVYSGFAGGSYFNNPGAAAEYVCLPPDPDFDKTSTYDGGHMFGAEYQGSSNTWGTHSLDENVPCAMCRTTVATSTVMISGKNRCYSGWTMQYRGYLASGGKTHNAASQFVCVDSHPEYLISGERDEDGKLFYPVITKCGSLPCPPYSNNYPLTCVVCSK